MNSPTNENEQAAPAINVVPVAAMAIRATDMPNRQRRHSMHPIGEFDFRKEGETKGVIMQVFFDRASASMLFRMPDDTGYIVRAEVIGNQLYSHWARQPDPKTAEGAPETA